jgi:hypothetical protein
VLCWFRRHPQCNCPDATSIWIVMSFAQISSLSASTTSYPALAVPTISLLWLGISLSKIWILWVTSFPAGICPGVSNSPIDMGWSTTLLSIKQQMKVWSSAQVVANELLPGWFDIVMITVNCSRARLTASTARRELHFRRLCSV